MSNTPQLFQDCAKPFPKEAYKTVRLGREFTTIDAYHIIERLTEVFGLCGEAWGVHVKEWRNDRDNVAAIGCLWYNKDGVAYEIEAVGDAHVMKGNIAEAYKKAQTNLISKASSFLGVGLSIYQGKGIDDPYLDRASEKQSHPTGKPTATRDDLGKIKAAREKAGLSKTDVVRIMEQAPFSCENPPHDLLQMHVPALINRIEQVAQQKGATA